MFSKVTSKPEMSWAVFLKNSLANVARGSSAALVALVLAPFLARNMATELYGTWLLILQLGAYTGYLDFGIQTAIGRFVAYYTESEDKQLRNEAVNTSAALLAGAMVLSLLLIGVLVGFWPHFFHQMPPSMYFQARMALLLVGGSLAIGLPFGVFNGIFIGLQKNEIPAVIFSANRILAAVLIVVLVLRGSTLVGLGIAVMAVNLLSYLAQYIVFRSVAPAISIHPQWVSRRARKEIFGYCVSLSIWSFATLLVTGLDTTIVAFVDFKSVAYYAVPATLITFILGLQNAVFSALVPVSAILEARSNREDLGRMLVSTSRYGVYLLLLSGVPLLLWARPILAIWVGNDYAIHSALILKVLVLANIIRLSAIPYAMLLVGTGQQRLVTISPIIEGVSNLVVSVIAGVMYGAIGVAIGTLVGSVIGILCNFVYNLPRSTTIAIGRLTYLIDGLLRPAACLLPLLLVIGLERMVPQLSAANHYLFVAMAWLLVAAIFLKYGLLAKERAWIKGFLNGSVVLSKRPSPSDVREFSRVHSEELDAIDKTSRHEPVVGPPCESKCRP